jgi:pyrimidine-nucleoside phosphorylase
MLRQAIKDGSALAKLRQMVELQGGDVRMIDDPSLFRQAACEEEICSRKGGYVSSVDALTIGNLAMRTGAGRAKKGDAIYPETGIILMKKPGDYVAAGEALAKVYYRDPLPEGWREECEQAFVLQDAPCKAEALIHSIL